MNYLFESLRYVMTDAYFLPAMGFTCAIGVFIGSLLYDGLLPEVKKAIISIISYAFLVSMTNFGRIVPIVLSGRVHEVKQPFAGIATLVFVTVYYILGMLLGVMITRHAHKGRHEISS